MNSPTVIIVHRWGATPQSDWYSWLSTQLKAKGFTVIIPEMPETNHPKINAWIQTLQETVEKVKGPIILVGHSIGCQTILRYLEKNQTNVMGTIFVAGWLHLTPAVTESETDNVIAKPWLTTPINFEVVKKRLGKSVAILSDDDPYVDLKENQPQWELLRCSVIVEHHMGHFDEDTGCKKLETVLDVIQKML